MFKMQPSFDVGVNECLHCQPRESCRLTSFISARRRALLHLDMLSASGGSEVNELPVVLSTLPPRVIPRLIWLASILLAFGADPRAVGVLPVQLSFQ